MIPYIFTLDKKRYSGVRYMGNRNRIDLVKISFYLLKRVWLIILCAAIGFGIMYYRAESNHRNTYTASGTMYIVNGNPNLINYQYTSMSDITSAVMLLDTYKEVVKSEKVLDAVVDRLAAEYPGITHGYISATINMSSVNNTGVTRVSCTTDDPGKSTDICNAVMDVAPSEIKRVVGARSVEVIDYADPDKLPGPNPHNSRRRGMTGAMIAEERLIKISTEHAKGQGAYTASNGACWWWLRSPGSASMLAALVHSDGDVGVNGNLVGSTNTSVVPAVRARLF